MPVPTLLATSRPGGSNTTSFSWRYSDRLLGCVGWGSVVLSTAALLGLSEHQDRAWLSMITWLTLWFLYLSIVNVGQTFYGFGWESMLLKAGFLSLVPWTVRCRAIADTHTGSTMDAVSHRDRGPAHQATARPMLARSDLSPVPLRNPTLTESVELVFPQLPRAMHRASVLFSHVVQIVMPFALFGPQPVAASAGAFVIVHQCWLE